MCFVCVSNAYVKQAEGHIGSDQSLFDSGVVVQTTTTSATFVAADYINTILGGQSWSASVGTAATVTYSFDYSAADSALVYSNAPFAFTAAQQAATKAAMADISKYVGVTFVEAASSSAANLHFYNGDLNFGGGNVSGLANYYYNPVNNKLLNATVGMDDLSQGFATKGSWEYVTLLHEIGHALGLKHAGNYNGIEDGPFLPSQYDNEDYTVMAYDNGTLGNATELRELDILALQYLYGAGTTPYSSATSSAATGGTPTNDSVSGTVGADTLYGGLGTDTLRGGDGNDTMYGGRQRADSEDSADQIYGDGGSDQLFGNSGNDTIFGDDGAEGAGGGNDTIYGGIGEDAIFGELGDDYLSGGGDVYHPGDQADNIVGGHGSDYILGNGGNDTISGDYGTAARSGDGNDTVYGGYGDDYILGGGGNDFLVGQFGNEYMEGGTGADTFYFYGADGVDIIGDFVSGTDKLRITSNINESGLTSAEAIIASLQSVNGLYSLVLGSTDNMIQFYGISEGGIAASDIELV